MNLTTRADDFAIADNKLLVTRMLAGETNWLEQWAADGVWTIPGSTKWSGIYVGKAEIAKIGALLDPIEVLPPQRNSSFSSVASPV